MMFNGQQFDQLHKALLSAFPSLETLRIMVRTGLGENLEQIAGGGNLSTIVFNLIEWTIAQGRSNELIVAACQKNPGNLELRPFCGPVKQAMIIIEMPWDKLDTEKIGRILSTLKDLTSDTTLTIRCIAKGSVKITVEGAAEGIERLLTMFNEGQLNTLMGYKVSIVVPGEWPGVKWNVLYERNPYFTGRDAELIALRDALTAHKNAALTQALSGMGGIGKTQTAIEYIYHCKEQEEGYPTYEYILFTRADSTNALLTGYGEIAKTIELPLTKPDDQQQVAAEVRQWLEANDNWLLLYDNADDPDLLRPFRPRNAKGHILLTSRAHHFKADLGVGKPIELKSLLPEDAVRFLFQRTLRDADKETAEERNAAAELAHVLGYFPLALEQAAAYIVAKEKRFAIYLADYRKREQELLNEAEPELGDYRNQNTLEYKTVRTTWDLNFAAIETVNPASAELLKFSAFLAPDNIPAELVILGARVLGPPLANVFAKLEDAIEIENAYDDLLQPLLNYSLIEKDRNARTFGVHRMVQSVLRDRLKEQQHNWAERLVDLLPNLLDFENDNVRPDKLRLLPHVLAALNHAKRVLPVTAMIQSRVRLLEAIIQDMEGDYVRAIEIGEEIKQTTPSSNPLYVMTCVYLATFYDHSGNRQEAVTMLNLIINQLDLENRHDNQYWWALFQRGTNLNGLNQLTEAAEDLLKVRQMALRNRHKTSALHQLGVIALKRGNYDEAIAAFRTCLDERGPNGRQRLAYEYRRLGEAYAERGMNGDRENALQAFCQALTVAKGYHFFRYELLIRKSMSRYGFAPEEC